MVEEEEISLGLGTTGRKEGIYNSGWRLSSKRRVVAKPSGMKRKDRRIHWEEQRRTR